jgi:hypothetical protein
MALAGLACSSSLTPQTSASAKNGTESGRRIATAAGTTPTGTRRRRAVDRQMPRRAPAAAAELLHVHALRADLPAIAIAWPT